MAIHTITDALMLAAAGAFGGYTFWTFSTALQALRTRAAKRRE